MGGKKRTQEGWRTIERVRLAGDVAYHLKRNADNSMWLAVRLDQNRGFFAHLLKRIEKVEAMLDAFGSDRAKIRSSPNDIQSRQFVHCPRCNSAVSEDHNYCGTCGTRVRA